ncbi:hypothetical protein E2562_029468 [Oryza meyeriana var. granulata]|uniref:Uncharacterized protein n=1 Tax=Oryza meyeriana var. granulata TaxID=110450 RepID=A0A6G1DQN9_9ORYZ|nr:hypothetical protein E2562_029468 [Oryza meyeriana var. granulata]
MWLHGEVRESRRGTSPCWHGDGTDVMRWGRHYVEHLAGDAAERWRSEVRRLASSSALAGAIG